MKTTLVLDSMGSLHAFKGDCTPFKASKYLFTVEGKPSTLFFQDQQDIQDALNNLTKQERKELQKGYQITTNNFPSDYFLIS